jgi:patatin-related protein
MDGDTAADVPRADEELRLALSLRGGVSLAVWIGGALAEIDQVAHAVDPVSEPAVNAQRYAQLLRLAGFNRVLIDVITGASAGGLNGVIYAASQIYGFAFDSMLDVWIELGDIERLTRPPVGRYTDPNHPGGAKLGRPASLLRGDEYFQRKLEEQLIKSIGSTPSANRADPMELILTATLARATSVERDDDPFTNIVESRNDALFRFQYFGQTDDRGDFQTNQLAVETDGAGRARPSSTAARLALAGRATSSFPFAFEPARIGQEMSAVFSDTPDTGSAWVIDGGVLDNIPVGKAIDAIAAAPAAVKTERWLLYLHPSPSGVGATAAVKANTGAPRGVQTALAALKTTFGQENLLQDLQQLRLFNEEAERQRLRRAGLFTRFNGRVGADLIRAVLESAAAESPSACRLRVDVDTQELHDVLTGQLDTSSFGDGLARNPTSHWPRPERDALLGRIDAALASVDMDGLVLRDGTALLALIDDLIRWIRDLESRTRLDAGHNKAILYAARLVADRLRKANDRVWILRTRQSARGSSWASASALISRSLLVASPPAATDVLNALDGVWLRQTNWSSAGNPNFFAVNQALDAWEASADELAMSGVAPETGVAFAAELWRRIVATAADVADRLVSSMPAPVRSAPSLSDLDGRPRAFDVLDAVGSSSSTPDPMRMDRVLAALVVLTSPLRARTVQMESELRFLEVSGNNTSPLQKYFQRPLNAKTKLCGNELANFAAFFSAKWRGNDWMWGRLDAAKSIVDLLLRPERLVTSGLPATEVTSTLLTMALSAGVPLTADEQTAIAGEVATAIEHPGAPGAPATLELTKTAIVEALQRQIVAELLERVQALGESPTSRRVATEGIGPATGPAAGSAAVDALQHFDVGLETIASLNPRRRTQIGMRLAMVGFKTVQPDGRRLRTRFVRGVMRFGKPVYLFSAFAALSLPRAFFLVCLALAGLLIGPWRYRNWAKFSWWKPFELPDHEHFAWNALHLVGIVGLIGLSMFAFSRYWHWRPLHGRSSNQRWRLLSAATGPVAIALDVAGIRTTPVLVICGAAVITALATSWMVSMQRLVSTALTIGTYIVTAAAAYLLARHRGFELPSGSYAGWWSVVSLMAAGTALAVQCSYCDVTPPVDAPGRK